MEHFMDMHCHCLPGIDDGAKTMEESLQMLKQAYADGIRTVIATPHYHHRRGHAPKEVILEKVQQVQEAISKTCPDLKIYAGNELHYSSSLPERIADEEVCTMAGSRYVLIEFAPEVEYKDMRNALRRIQTQGAWPILAHIERYFCLVKKPALAEELADMEVYLQVNADGVLGNYGRKEKSLIKKMFAKGLISFVATDAHDTEHRKQVLSEAAAYITKKFGEDVAEQVFFTNQQKVVNNSII